MYAGILEQKNNLVVINPWDLNISETKPNVLWLIDQTGEPSMRSCSHVHTETLRWPWVTCVLLHSTTSPNARLHPMIHQVLPKYQFLKLSITNRVSLISTRRMMSRTVPTVNHRSHLWWMSLENTKWYLLWVRGHTFISQKERLRFPVCLCGMQIESQRKVQTPAARTRPVCQNLIEDRYEMEVRQTAIQLVLTEFYF